MPMPAQDGPDRRQRDARYRRDAAMGRTRRLSWMIAGGAAAAMAALAGVFAQLLPGHSAAASTGAGAPAPAAHPATSSQAGAAPQPAQSSPAGQSSQPVQSSQPAPPPVPSSAPVVVSGGS